MRVGDFVFSSNLLTKDDLVDIVELVPVVVEVVGISVQGFETRSTGNSDVESFSSEESFWFEEVVVILVGEIGEEGTSESVEGGHLGEVEVPNFVR